MRRLSWMVMVMVVVVTGLVGAATAEIVTFDGAAYPNPGTAPTINGVDGWVASTAMVYFGGPVTTYDGTVGMWNNADANQIVTAERDFAPVTEGTLTYQIRPAATTSEPAHWLLLTDAGWNEGYLLQFRARGKSGGSNTLYEFYAFFGDGAGGSGAESSPDNASIQFASSIWYEVKINFNVNLGATGTFTLTVTRLDTNEVVWSLVNKAGRYKLSDVGRFREHGSTHPGGYATWYDNIKLEAGPGPGFPKVTLQGTVVPGGYSGDLRNIGLKVELIKSGSEPRIEWVVPNINGVFQLTDVDTGTYTVAVKGTSWLREVNTNVSVLADPSNAGTFNLTAGDNDGDDNVTSTDLAVVLANME